MERPATVILVDDTPASLELLEAVLAAPDRRLLTAASGEQALALLADEGLAQATAAIVLDVHMPGLDGFETARRIKEQPATRDLPIIFLTGSSDSSQVRGYESGAVDYITKPFDPQILQSKIAVFIDLWQKTQDLQELAELRRQSELDQLRRESEQRYRTLTNAMPQMAWVSDADGTVRYLNRRWFEYTGARSDSQGIQAYVHPDDRGPAEAAWQEALAKGRVFEAEQRILRARDGSYRWHLARALPTRDEPGQIVGWVGTMTDIEDQKRVAADLEAQYEVARVLQDEETLAAATDRLLEALGRPLGAYLTALWLRQGQTLVCVGHWCGPDCSSAAARGLTGQPLPLEHSLPGEAATRGEVRWLRDAMRDPRFQRPLPAGETVHGWVGVPIEVGDEVGLVIELFQHEARGPDPDLLAVLTAVANQVGQFVERERAQAESRRRQQRLELLARAGGTLAGSLDYELTLANVAHLIVPEFADWCVVYLLEDQGIRPLVAAHSDPERERFAQDYVRRFPPRKDEAGGPAEIMRTGQASLVPEITEQMVELAFAEEPERVALLKQLGLRSQIGVPMTAHGRVIGTITFLMAESERSYGEEDLAFAEELARRAGLAIDNARLYHDRNEVAQTLERSLLPPSLPRVPHVEVAARYRAATAGTPIGGDFYDLFALDDDRWLAVIGDVVGKGAAAAALTGLARHTMRAAAMRDSEPEAILAMLNEAVLRGGGDGQFCTVVCAQLRPTAGRLDVVLADAGHPLPYVVRADGVERVDVRGVPLGMWPEADIALAAVTLAPDDKLVLYTDGVIEARRRGELYGEARLAAFLTEHRALDAALLAEALEVEVVSFQEEGIRDDIAILVIQGGDDERTPSLSLLSSGSRGATSPRVDMRLEPSPRSVAVARHALEALRDQLGPDQLATAQLLVSELVSNAVKHSFSDDEAYIGFTASVESGSLKVTVADQGLGFDPSSDLSSPDSESGRGLYLVDALATRWGVEQGEMTNVWFELAVDADDALTDVLGDLR